MIAKTSCQHCEQHIEFEVENAGEFVPCPSCGKQTQPILKKSKSVLLEKPKSYGKPVGIVMVLAMAVCVGVWLGSLKGDHLDTPPQRPTVPDSIPKPISPQKQSINEDALWAKHLEEITNHLEEITQRVHDHYNSATEVAYRQAVASKEHFQHLHLMNAIENGASNLELEVMKLRQQQEIQAIEAAHEIRESEWRHEEKEWMEKWQKAHE